jgi:hypothetical protein
VLVGENERDLLSSPFSLIWLVHVLVGGHLVIGLR